MFSEGKRPINNDLSLKGADVKEVGSENLLAARYVAPLLGISKPLLELLGEKQILTSSGAVLEEEGEALYSLEDVGRAADLLLARFREEWDLDDKQIFLSMGRSLIRRLANRDIGQIATHPFTQLNVVGQKLPERALPSSNPLFRMVAAVATIREVMEKKELGDWAFFDETKLTILERVIQGHNDSDIRNDLGQGQAWFYARKREAIELLVLALQKAEIESFEEKLPIES